MNDINSKIAVSLVCLLLVDCCYFRFYSLSNMTVTVFHKYAEGGQV